MILRLAGLAVLFLVPLATTTACDAPAPAPAPGPPEAGIVAAPAEAERALLERIVEAERTLSFAGWKTVQHGPPEGSRTSRVHVHRDTEGTTLLSWEQRESGDIERSWAFRRRAHWIDHPQLLLANYSVSLAPEPGERVAWRDTLDVRVRSRRPGRPSLDISVDAETWLPLAEVRRDHAGAIESAWEFEALDYDPALPPDAPARPEALSAPGGKDGDGCNFEPLVVANVPAGFERVACRLLDCGSLREFWSDGLAAFAVRQRPAAEDESLPDGEVERRTAKGRAQVRGHLGGMLVEVAGTLPVDELEQVARGLLAPPAD